MPTSDFATKRQLAVFLSKLATFEQANPTLEQYPTDSEVGADVLWHAYMAGDISGKQVADLGCGTGILGIGALALGAAHVTFVDVDERALAILERNLASTSHTNTTILCADISAFTTHVDTIVQNPPFGTRDKGADTHFLVHAMAHAQSIYSIHKASTQAYLQHIVEREGKHVHEVLPYAFPLKRTMAHHTRRITRIDVICLHITSAA